MKLTWIIAAGLAAVLAGCGGGGTGASPTKSAPAASATTTSRAVLQSPTSSTSRTHRRRRRGPAPGSLPQTHALPTAHSTTFAREMDALWRGIRTNAVSAALPAFFPKAAYAQVKAISNPDADWRDRLVRTFGLDIAAAHALLSASGAHATLVRVDVPSGFAHWVDPGVCYNRVGYWEVPNARVVYRDAGSVRSFGIASMISWRGVWYVVHLGAVTGDTGGTVNAPSSGPGVSTPSSTC